MYLGRNTKNQRMTSFDFKLRSDAGQAGQAENGDIEVLCSENNQEIGVFSDNSEVPVFVRLVL